MQKQPVIAVPGLLCDAALWARQVSGLAAQAEFWVPDVSRDDTMAGMAKRLLEEAPFEHFALAGLSMGGMVCFEIMRQAPERVDRLALLDTNPRPDTPDRTQQRIEFMELVQRGKRFTTINKIMLPRMVHPSRVNDVWLVAAIDGMADRVGMPGYLNQQRAIIARPDSRADLIKIRCPTLVLCGREDALTPLEMHEEMVALILGSRLEIIEECGHLSTMEKPDEVNRALSVWLKMERPVE